MYFSLLSLYLTLNSLFKTWNFHVSCFIPAFLFEHLRCLNAQNELNAIHRIRSKRRKKRVFKVVQVFSRKTSFPFRSHFTLCAISVCGYDLLVNFIQSSQFRFVCNVLHGFCRAILANLAQHFKISFFGRHLCIYNICYFDVTCGLSYLLSHAIANVSNVDNSNPGNG